MDHRAYPSHPRSTAFAANGMAATSHPAASLAAIDLLRAGGSAIDAAVGASAVLGVVEPMSTGIGGDAFCLLARAGAAKPLAFNGSGRAPAGTDLNALVDRGERTVDENLPLAVTVPGAVDAYCRLVEDHGRLGIDQVLQPAIHLAENGCPVAPVIAQAWNWLAPRVAADPVAREVLLDGGAAPGAGSVHTQPRLARALREIAAKGRMGFYEGWVASDLVDRLRRKGGVHSLEDFANASGEYVDPISTELAGYTVWECPPNGQGVIALLMLNVLGGFDLAGTDPLGADRLHLTLEAGRLAFRDRALHLADPRQSSVPTMELLSAAYADQLRSRIDPKQAMERLPSDDPRMPGDTVYISVVDRDGNAASFISSLYHGFGSCIVGPESGVTLHCRGTGFVVEPGHPNCIAPGKRPMHTIIPGMLSKEDRVVMPFGVMGGDYQPWGHTHVLQNLLLYGMDVQEALDLPRFTHDGVTTVVEEGVPRLTARELSRRGHLVAAAAEPLGGGQAIWIDEANGVLRGGTEPRKDGIALGY